MFLEPPRMTAASSEIESQNCSLGWNGLTTVRHRESMISKTDAVHVKLESNMFGEVSTRRAKYHRRNCHIRIVPPVELCPFGRPEHGSMLLRECVPGSQRQSSPKSAGISVGFCLVSAINRFKFLNRLNRVQKVYKPFEPSDTKHGKGNGYNRV
jgi:hypothetical protein